MATQGMNLGDVDDDGGPEKLTPFPSMTRNRPWSGVRGPGPELAAQAPRPHNAGAEVQSSRTLPVLPPTLRNSKLNSLVHSSTFTVCRHRCSSSRRRDTSRSIASRPASGTTLRQAGAPAVTTFHRLRFSIVSWILGRFHFFLVFNRRLLIAGRGALIGLGGPPSYNLGSGPPDRHSAGKHHDPTIDGGARRSSWGCGLGPSNIVNNDSGSHQAPAGAQREGAAGPRPLDSGQRRVC